MKPLSNPHVMQMIADAKLDYHSETSWSYTYDDGKCCLTFHQTEAGRNEVVEFCIKKNGIWVDLIATDEQLKAMYKRLNETEYRPVEDNDELFDPYKEYGINPGMFISGSGIRG